MSDAVVPFDADAERAVLGAVMMSVDALDNVLAILEPGDLYEARHGSVYAAVRRLWEHGEPTDVIAVVDELGRAGALVGSLDAAYVHGLTSAVPTAGQASYHATIVHEHAVMRRLQAVGASIVEMAVARKVDAVDAVELARERIDSVGATSRARIMPVGEQFTSFVDVLEEKPRYVPTPWHDINKHIGGFRAGSLIVIGARPAQGKSIMGLQAAVRLAKEGPVAYISLEMPKDEVLARMTAQIAQVSLQGLMNHAVPRDAWPAIAMHRQQIEQMPLFVATSDEVQTVTQVRSFARSVARKAPKGQRLAGVVVDYLQLAKSGERSESRQVEVSEMSRQLKLLAQALSCPVIALSQLNRGRAQGRGTGRPSLESLRESGAIEQDADVVMLLHRDEKNRPSVLEVDIAKNRQGLNGRVSLQWEGTFARVLSKAWSPTGLLDEEEK